MPTVVAYHDVKDTDHWLASPKRDEFFGPLGVTNIRTFVDPQNRNRVGLLMDIPDEAMKGIRSASEPYAKLLASQVRQRFSTDWGLSETGATGPTGNRYGDAAGHSCMAVAGPAQSVFTLETGSADRQANMQEFAKTALNLLLENLSK